MLQDNDVRLTTSFTISALGREIFTSVVCEKHIAVLKRGSAAERVSATRTKSPVEYVCGNTHTVCRSDNFVFFPFFY